jgi:membrane protease YdiL (CAAX protease family)
MNIEVLIFEFEEKYKINKLNIVYYGIYLALINSLLEEFFFRGFIFLSLKKIGMKRVAYLTSSIAFAIYHVGNFQNWFNIWVFVLATTGLFIGGMIFNYLDDHENTFLNSWYVHICADLALVGIGLSIFQVI